MQMKRLLGKSIPASIVSSRDTIITAVGAQTLVGNFENFVFGLHNPHNGLFEFTIGGQRVASWILPTQLPHPFLQVSLEFSLCASNLASCSGTLDVRCVFSPQMTNLICGVVYVAISTGSAEHSILSQDHQIKR